MLQRACISSEKLFLLSELLTSKTIRSTLQEINLSSNLFFDLRSLKHFIKALQALKSLKRLNLSNNYIGDELGCFLIKNLEEKPQLEYINLANTGMGECSLMAAKHHLAENKFITYLNLSGGHFKNKLSRFFKGICFFNNNEKFLTK